LLERVGPLEETPDMRIADKPESDSVVYRFDRDDVVPFFLQLNEGGL